MTSLLGRLLKLFPDSVPLEDLFTEAVARLFEVRPQLCLTWLEDAGLISSSFQEEAQGHIRVMTQRSFAALESHETNSRPDLLIEVFRSASNELVNEDPVGDVVMIESKIEAGEGPEQLRRYAEHLDHMAGFGNRTLLYITRSYDPKNSNRILAGLSEDIRFHQSRWHDFYRFLTTVKEDALVNEVKLFMEEHGMSRSYRFSATDLMALSEVPRAFEIFDETLGGEVRAELETFAGNKIRRETHSIWEMRAFQRYLTRAFLHRHDLFCDLGYQLGKVDESAYSSILRISEDGYPEAFVDLETQPRAEGREDSIAAMRRIALNEEWEPFNLDSSSDWAGVRRSRSLANLLPEEDHVAAVKRFFIESIRQLRKELTEFKKEHPDLLWSGE